MTGRGLNDYNMVEEGFLEATHRSLLIAKDSPKQLLDAFENYQAPNFKIWMHEDES